MILNFVKMFSSVGVLFSNYCVSLDLLLGSVMSAMKKAFNIPEDTETRVWNKFMTNSCELLTNLEQTVQDAGLYQGQVRRDETKILAVEVLDI